MYPRILVPIDGSEPSQAGLREALALAASQGSELHLLHVVDDAPLVDSLSSDIEFEPYRQRLAEKGQNLLAQASALCSAHGQPVQTHLFELQLGRVSHAIVRQALDLGCELIVIGSHGRRGLGRTLLGSDAEGVLRESPLPVLMVRASAAAAPVVPTDLRVPYRRILVPVDGSDGSNSALDEAVRLVRPTKGRIRLLHVVDELSLSLALDPAVTLSRNWLGLLRQGGETILQQARERVRAAGLEAETVLVSSLKRRVWDAVVADSKHWMADLIVIGSHGRRGVGRLLMGSDAEQIARHAPVPVLLLHPVPGVATTLARPLAATPARAVSAAVEVEELELTFGAVSAGH